MAIKLSPGVVLQEQEAGTLSTTENSDKIAAIAGAFQWGPVDVPTFVSGGESDFVSRFGPPNSATAKYVMPALDFLSYSNSMWVVRQVGVNAKNAFPSGTSPQLVKNDSDFVTRDLTGTDFLAKYPGVAGNGIVVQIVDSANFDAWEYAGSFNYKPHPGEFSVAVIDSSGFWTGEGSNNQKERLIVNGTVTTTGNITIFGATVAVTAGDSATAVAQKIADDADIIALFNSVSAYNSAVTYVSKTAGKQAKQAAPAAQNGLTFRTEVSDAGRSGTLLEKYELLSNVQGETNTDGTTKFWYDAINNTSLYIRAGDKTKNLTSRNVTLVGGADDNTINITTGLSKLVNKEAYTLQFVIVPAVTVAEQMSAIDLVETRGDCMAFVAPDIADVVNNPQGELASVLDWRLNRLNRDSTYAFTVDNWGYMYDKYNDVYRWVPATGGTAGLAARCFVENEMWISFAGFQRGRYKNYVKMAWTASEEDRNQLYKVGVNSVVTFPGQGIVLFGDKTATSRPTAYNHVNTRWASIAMKQILGDLAKYFLFELNDKFTQAQFVNAARPKLRNLQSRKAMEDFKLIVDDTNNTGAVKANNEMVGKIMWKPLYSINWVTLTLDAVRPDVSFSEAE